MAHAVMLRSSHAHARITRIDTEQARAVPGVLAVYTGADIEGALQPMPCAWLLPDSDLKVAGYPCIAKDVVRYTGDIVAVVVAERPWQGHDALDLIEVDYEPLPAVTDPEAAAADGAPQLHADIDGNRAFHWVVAGGDVDAAFAEAEANGVVIRERILQQRLIPNAMEPRGAVAQYSRPTGELTLWNTTQNPHIVRFLCSVVTGIPEDKAARHRAGSGRRLRQQDRGLPRRLHHGVLLEAARPAGQVDRDAQRELPGNDARARPRAGRRAGGHEGRQDHGAALHGARRHGRLPVHRGSRHPDHPARPDAVGVLHDPGPQGGRLRRLHQRRPGGGVPRRRPAGSDVHAGAGDRHARRRAGDGPRGGPPPELHPRSSTTATRWSPP